MKYGCLSLLIALTAGCTTTTTTTLTEAIINGDVDDGDPNVVLVFAQVPGASGGALCSGEIVSPHVVLTAAHCLSPTTVGPGNQFIVFPGTTFPLGSAPLPGFVVKETHYLPSFDHQSTEFDTDDVGVLILESPTTIAPLPFNHFPFAAPAINTSLPARLVGYGLTNGTDTTGATAGTRHQAPSALIDMRTQTLTFWDGVHSNCEGDSGGPALMMLDGKERIAGITQTGYRGCPVKLAQTDTRVDAYAGFIDQYVTMFDPAPVAAGDACTSDADCVPFPCLGGICAQPCEGSAASSACPAGTSCSDVDGKSMCSKAHGCAMGGPVNDGSALMLLVVLALLVRRRRA